MTVKVDFKKVENIDKDFSGAIQEGLDEIGKSIVDGAQSTVHVITGRLRDSITILDRGENFVLAGTDLYYAAAEEFGTATRGPHPYMGPQADRMQSEAANILQRKINDAL